MTAPEASITHPPLAAPPISLIALTPSLAQSAVHGRLNAAPGWPEVPYRGILANIATRVTADPQLGALVRLITLPDSSNPQGWRVIGDVGVKLDRPVEPGLPVEIGYSVARNFRGRGFGSRAVHVFCQYLLDQGFTTLEAETEPGNAASERLLEKAGFSVSERGPAGTRWVFRRREGPSRT